MKALAVARREVAAYLLAPSSYLVAALFLAVEGWSFWLFTSIANGRATQWTALRYFFGGSLTYWLFLVFVASVTTMRLLAEERRAGTIEPLLTAPVSAAEVVVGKYLGAVAFYVALWLPTLAYVAILARYAPSAPDWGPLAGGYLGTLLAGLSALAVGLAASSLTQHQILAAALAFLALTALLLAGVAGGAVAPESAFRPLLERLDLMRQMEDFGRGVVDLRAVTLHLGVAAAMLWAATRALELPSSPSGAGARYAIELGLVAAIAVGLNVAAARHPRRFDLSRARVNTLAPRTEEILARLDHPVAITVLMLPSGAPADPYDEVRDLLELYSARSARLRVEWIGEGERDRARALASQYHLGSDQLADGAVVFSSGARSRAVLRRDLARVEEDQEGAPRIAAFTGEQAFDGALMAVSGGPPSEICFTRGHGEAAIDSLAVDGMSDLGDALRRDDATLRTLGAFDAGIPESCDVTVLAGPERAYSPSEAAAIEARLQRGGRVLVLLGAVVDPGLDRLARVGLEDLLGRFGVVVRDAIAFDPSRMSRRELAWAVDDGYADHPITSSFPGRRTVWSMARALAPAPGPGLSSVALVETGERGWGETDLASVVRDRARLGYQAGSDLAGPIAVAVASERNDGKGGGARLVVLGSREIARNDHDVSYNRDLLVSAIEWLARRDPLPTATAAREAELSLRLDDAELRRVFAVCVLGLPLCVLLFGLGVWWRRRR